MLDLQHAAGLGEYWRVTSTLASSEPLVIPAPLRQGPVTAANDRHVQRMGLIVLAIHYRYTAGAADVGFDLLAEDEVVIPGSTNLFPIWTERSSGSGRVANSITDLWVPLSPAAMTSTPVHGATLRLQLTSTPPSSGFLTVVGLHTSQYWGVGFTGSPLAFS